MLPERDAQGYIRHLGDWNEEIAGIIANEAGIKLGKAHWEIIHSIREFYQKFDSSPATRALIKWLALKLGKEKGNSLYVMELFPGSPAKLVARIAGLPRPSNCI